MEFDDLHVYEGKRVNGSQPAEPTKTCYLCGRPFGNGRYATYRVDGVEEYFHVNLLSDCLNSYLVSRRMKK